MKTVQAFTAFPKICVDQRLSVDSFFILLDQRLFALNSGPCCSPAGSVSDRACQQTLLREAAGSSLLEAWVGPSTPLPSTSLRVFDRIFAT